MKELGAEEFNKNPFQLIGREWMLVTAKKGDKMNTMTAAWGGLGIMWDKNVAFIVIRPSRYTKEFIDSADTLSLTFYDKEYKKQLAYLGSVSGRDEDKISKSNFTVVYEGETPYFKEANLAIICKKLFRQEFTPDSFVENGLAEKYYPGKDYHTLYIAEIEKFLVSE
ncbi:flavin reductase family protein [Anaerocolumna sp. AGMB13020]|uniref:flavin reductase n=1 Tax=Anaerocolumna sp. AGMB13020 TaxID=3081750 RepID=UPI002952DC97|nr:flavin reductase [Anaerocolumna sp. AGMB13020]WOO35065.1 flavin reductase family protein [Anaerocolumna sp. AGMB13020]